MRAPDTNEADVRFGDAEPAPRGTIRASGSGQDPETLAIRALAWTLADDRRAERLLALTGLDADALRGRAGDPALLGSVIAFLAAHEPDLVACAEALDLPPATLAAVADRLPA